MQLDRIDHYTLRCTEAQLDSLRGFYGGVLGLQAGPRPDFDFPGVWFYLGGRPVVHLAAFADRTGADAAATAAAATRATATAATGAATRAAISGFDHVAFRASGLAATRQRLTERGMDWTERPVPGFPLHQVFLTDPLGVRIELTFDSAEVAQSG
jgi:catechol 2,3-dioxygenase-like lactoylglutathione lyase family enzyme